VIAWPGLVTAFLDTAPNVDPSKIEIVVPPDESGSQPPASDDDFEKQYKQGR